MTPPPDPQVAPADSDPAVDEARVRRGNPADLEALLPLNAAFCAMDGHPFDASVVRRAITPLLSDDALGQVWVVERDDVLLGYAVLTWGYSLESGGRDSLLDEIYLAERSGGLGSALLATCLEAARSAGASRTFLETESANTRVRRFYARHGFAEEDSVWMSLGLG